MKKYFNPLSIFAILWSCFQIYVVYGMPLSLMVAVPIHVMFAAILVFISKPLIKSRDARHYSSARLLDVASVLACIAIALYFYLEQGRITTRIAGVDPVMTSDFVVGILTVILVVEATRRLLGRGLTIVILAFLVYQFMGTSMRGLPGIGALAHGGGLTASFFRRFLELQTLQNEGIFGIPSIVSYTQVMYFLLFGAFLETFGGGKLFIDLATLLVGRFRGGMAKVAVIGSTMFGAISGSATANAAIVGNFTIPAMRKSGLSAEEAAAVEAAASTGGQIIPPVMGAAAFLIAQFMGESYRNIAISAIIPALLYYAALFFVIDNNAKKFNIKGVSAAELNVTWKSTFLRLYLFIPVVSLVYDIFVGRSLSTSTLRAVVLTIILGYLTRLYGKVRGGQGVFSSIGAAAREIIGDSISALESGGKASVTVAIPCAGAGIIVGIATMTNLGLTFGGFMLAISGGYLVPSLLIVMVMVIIMGMGMPTTAAYIMGSILAVPALQSLDLPLISIHFFVLYFAVLSMVTPPVALATFVAAGIAGADVWKTGWIALRNSFAGFFVAFALVRSPALLLEGPVHIIVLHSLVTLASCYIMAACLVGFWRTRNSRLDNILMFAIAVSFLSFDVVYVGVGLAILAIVWLGQGVRIRKLA
ncbi:TRAP transporter fused permease subunit [Castellaniella sp. GW247-6E4]|uniref:TRAP transporter permease n=1 Tax=Castellaniella sp. GW247-6E4 TaxID=3140380 RepID=UPI0033149EE6